MPRDLGRAFHRLYNECAFLHLQFREFVGLYGEQEDVDVLNRTAPGVFKMLGHTLWEAILLHIFRLTDNTESRRRNRKRLTVLMLSPLVDDSALQATLRRLASKARTASEFAHDHRDRHIAHRDLELAIEASAKPLAPASRKQVKAAIDAITNVLNAVESHYCKAETAYEHVSQRGDATALLAALRDGIELRRRRHGE